MVETNRARSVFVKIAVRLLIIVDGDIFEMDAPSTGDTKVVTTIAGGRIVYEAEGK